MSVFVTCLYDIATFEKNSQRKPASFYLQHITLLQKLGHPIVVFTSADLFAQVSDLFRNVPNATVILRPFEECAYFNRLTDMDAISLINPYITRSPFKDTSLFKILIWNKSEFVGIVAREFPQYNTFIWIDFGLEYVVKNHIKSTNIADILSKFDDTHFCCTVINPLSEHEYNNLQLSCQGWRFRQVGGFWSIGRKNIEFFVHFIRKEIDRLFQEKYTCTEEDLMARFVFAHGDKCKLSFGDYDTCMINWSGLLHQVRFIPSVLRKLQDSGKHDLALYGYEGLLVEYFKGVLPMSVDNMFHLFYHYFISLFYIDKLKAKEVAVQLSRAALINTRIRELLTAVESDNSKKFHQVLTQDELNVLSPGNFNDQPFFKSILSRMSINQFAIEEGPNIFQSIDLYNIQLR
jgi:hypothetical protein